MLFSRRVRFAIIILASQLLLIAMAITTFAQMVLIVKHNEIFFVEANPVVLYGEIVISMLIILFGITVFYLQCKRLGEKRQDDVKENYIT